MRHKPESAGTQSTGKTARGRETVRMAAVLLAAAAIALALLLKPAAPKTGSGDGETVQVLVDGEDRTGKPAGETAAEGLHVYITLNGEELITLPFGEAHTIRIIRESRVHDGSQLPGARLRADGRSDGGESGGTGHGRVYHLPAPPDLCGSTIS